MYFMLGITNFPFFSPICSGILGLVATTHRNGVQKPCHEAQTFGSGIWLPVITELLYYLVTHNIQLRIFGWDDFDVSSMSITAKSPHLFFQWNVRRHTSRPVCRLGDYCLASNLTCNVGNRFPEMLLLFYRYVGHESWGATPLNKI